MAATRLGMTYTHTFAGGAAVPVAVVAGAGYKGWAALEVAKGGNGRATCGGGGVAGTKNALPGSDVVAGECCVGLDIM